MSGPRASQLTCPEAAELEQREARIERGLQAFLEVGNDLLAIRDKRRYRDYGSFDDYCRERWGMSKTHASRMIVAAEVCVNLKRFRESLGRWIEELEDLSPQARAQAKGWLAAAAATRSRG